MRTTLFLLLLAIALCAQPVPEDDSPAFGLTSSQTWQPGEKATVTLLCRRVPFVDFRIYRVSDTARFFENLKDLHQFGSPKPPVPTELTPLERFHNWKRARRAAVRNWFRAQFSKKARETLAAHNEARVRRRMPLNKAAFAQLPLLNPNRLVSSWREMLPNTADTDYRSIPIEVSSPGVYLVEAVNGPLRAYTVTIVTGVAVVTKSFPGQVLAFVTDRKTGAPVADAEVTVISPGKPRTTGRTSAEGLYVFSPSERENSPRPTVLLARRGDDTAVNEVESFSLWQAQRNESAGLVYTDRPVYRPGQKVYFRGIGREVSEDKMSVPREPVTAIIRDQGGKIVYKRPASFTAFGSLSGEFDIPLSAGLGFYSIGVDGTGVNLFGSFQVEEYKKPEYEVKVLTGRNRVVQGQPIEITIDARYFFGEPVANARVEYVVHRAPYWSPLRYSDPDDAGDLESGNQEYYDYGGEQILQQQTQLDSQGRAAVTISTDVDAKAIDRRYRIEARVTDASNRTVSGHRTVIATYGDFLVTGETSKYVYAPGETVRLNVRTTDYEEKPVSKPVRFELAARDGKQRRVFASGQVSTGADGKAVYEFAASGAGSVEITLYAPDASGREVRSTEWYYVSGGGGMGWEDTERISILPDKKTYAPGETARLTVVTAKENFSALVTIEGHGIYEHRVVHSAGTSFTAEFPIRENYSPNVFCSVAFLKDNQLFQGSRRLKVPVRNRRLSVEIATDKERYRPNEAAEWQITAKDENGKPVSAEFSLGIVDEAIYGVRPDTTQDLMQVFYGPRWNRVGTNYSTWYYFHGWSGERALEIALRRPHTLADFKAEGRPVQPKVRRYFPDTVYWTPAVTTNDAGTARVRMEFPDSITAWRGTARGITVDTMVGSAVRKIVTRKNLILRLETPRFLVEKDEAVVSGIVHNYLASDQRVRLSLAVKGAGIVEGGEKDVNVATRGEARVDWRIRAGEVGDATITAKALADQESDAIELPLPVLPAGTRLTSSISGLLTGRRADGVVSIPGESNPAGRALRLVWSASLAGSLFSAMDYLSSYPYGCTEQILSSFVPNVALKQAMAAAGVKMVRDPAELDRKVRDGLNRLYEMQHEDGGWGWWPADEDDAFMTAYVVEGLADAAAAGYQVDPYRLERGRKVLLAIYRQHPRAVADLKAFLVYALEASARAAMQPGDPAAGTPPGGGMVDEIFAASGKLSAQGRAYLILTLFARKDTRAASVLQQIEGSATQSGTTAFWQATRDELLDLFVDSSKEATALSVRALLAGRKVGEPVSPLVTKAVRWLVESRTGYYWDSTKQTANVIRSLAPYMAETKELEPDYRLRFLVNGKEVAAQRVSAGTAVNPLPFELVVPAAQLNAGENRIAIEKEGGGALYWAATAEYRTPGPLRTSGLSIDRQYSLLVPQKTSSGEILYRQELVRGVVNVGDIVLAQVTVSGDDWRYLMVEDPIPAGTEPIEREDLYNFQDRPGWWQTYFSRREFRDNRVVLFRERFPKGKQVFHYLLKVIRAGSFLAAPARVEPMYQPGHLAATPAAGFRITEQSR